jgi:voltage-gated potassium channel
LNKENSNILDSPFFASIIAGLIIFSVICFSLETMPGLRPSTYQYLQYAEYLVVVVFTFEYAYRIWSTPKKLSFIFSFYGVIDLLAILPFYISSGFDLRSLRLLRLLRLIRLLKLVRYSKAVKRFNNALFMAKEELVVFSFASVIMIFIAAVGIYHFEHEAQPLVFASIFDSLWWAVTSFTTVGYGDMFPITTGGRIFTFFVLMIGVGLIAVPTGIIASSLAQIRKSEDKQD